MNTTPARQPARRDPRVARSRTAVIEATIRLLREAGFAGTTVEAISARSGVAKTTIYRHWDSLAELMASAVATCADPPSPAPTGDLRTDLETILRGVARALTRGPWAGLLPTLIDAAARDPELARLFARFSSVPRKMVRRIITNGIRQGDIRADVDPDEVVEMLGAPLFFRRLVTRRPITDAYVTRLVDLVLAAVGTDRLGQPSRRLRQPSD